MLKCTKCGCDVAEKDALVHKNKDQQDEIICPACFEKLAGIDYKTFAYRKESAKQTFWAVALCLATTVYAFAEKGPLYGAFGLVCTILIWRFTSKIK